MNGFQRWGLALGVLGVAVLASHDRPTRRARSNDVRAALREGSAGKAPAEGRRLFGSLTCPLDALALDQMLPHQLRQSASQPFDHNVLYVAPCKDRATAKQASLHGARLERVHSMQLVDEMVNVDELNHIEMARQGMGLDETNAKIFNQLPMFSLDESRALSAFLVKCLDGYDHCAWLDGDIFVHRGSMPWVDEAIQRHTDNPEIIIGVPSNALAPFSSRYFVLHRKGLQRLLPLSGTLSDTFEFLVNENVARSCEHCVFQAGQGGGSWVIHPPDKRSQLHNILEACEPGGDGLSALIAIVEQGWQQGETAYEWRDGGNPEDMDVASWTRHTHEYCRSLTVRNVSRRVP